MTEKAGLGDPTSKSLGVTVLDYNDDGWPDLFVSNDTQPNKLYRNNQQRHVHGRRHGGRAWLTAKTAWRAEPWARIAADYDRTGRPHLLVGNFSNQMLGLYHNEGNGLVRG